jgi:ABC-type polysaccharide/polyol phosphate transport system ATPase subunit
MAGAMALSGIPMRRRDSIISVRHLTLRIPIARKGKSSLVANPFSLLANFYMPSHQKREVRTILDDLNFELDEGSRLALIGRNGAGKTTLLRILAGSVFPSRGTITTRGTVQALLNVAFPWV